MVNTENSTIKLRNKIDIECVLWVLVEKMALSRIGFMCKESLEARKSKLVSIYSVESQCVPTNWPALCLSIIEEEQIPEARLLLKWQIP